MHGATRARVYPISRAVWTGFLWWRVRRRAWMRVRMMWYEVGGSDGFIHVCVYMCTIVCVLWTCVCYTHTPHTWLVTHKVTRQDFWLCRRRLTATHAPSHAIRGRMGYLCMSFVHVSLPCREYQEISPPAWTRGPITRWQAVTYPLTRLWTHYTRGTRKGSHYFSGLFSVNNLIGGENFEHLGTPNWLSLIK